LFSKGAKKIFKSRKICSLYFENKKKDMFIDSIEGSLPRKKIRIRYYPNDNFDQIYFEKKISGVEGRFKKRNVISNQEFENIKINGVSDNQYGICNPNIFVTYEREYLKLGDVRITVDKDIFYQEFKKDIKFKDPNIIVELKTSADKDLDDLIKLFPFQNIRFSKYCNGIQTIFNA
tara:strand:- start:911 stop:1438 length:528 start_codon:yes stop_codon:yes gene_type:complete